MTETKIKKYSIIYDLLRDLNEFEMADAIETKLNKNNYFIEVVWKNLKGLKKKIER